jgi:hypothetical protein
MVTKYLELGWGPPIQWVPGVLSLGLKAAEAWIWPLTSIWCRGQDCVELYLRSPNTPSWSGAHLKAQGQLHLCLCLWIHWDNLNGGKTSRVYVADSETREVEVRFSGTCRTHRTRVALKLRTIIDFYVPFILRHCWTHNTRNLERLWMELYCCFYTYRLLLQTCSFYWVIN